MSPTTDRSNRSSTRNTWPCSGCYEAWADYRRTGYPVLTIGSGTFTDHILPTRLVYPTNTMETNKEKYNAAVERLRTYYGGADDMKTPVGWSKAAVDTGIK